MRCVFNQIRRIVSFFFQASYSGLGIGVGKGVSGVPVGEKRNGGAVSEVMKEVSWKASRAVSMVSFQT